MSRDLRKYAQSTTVRLFVGFLAILFIIGEGLIFWRYGSGAAAMGMMCLLAGLAPLLLIAVFLYAIEWFLRRARDE